MEENNGHKIKNILFIIPSFSYGGAERVLIQLLNGLDRSKFQLSVVTFLETNYYAYEIPKHVNIICLNKKSALSFFRLVYTLSKMVQKERPALLISFLTYANYMSVLANKISRINVPHLITVHANLRQELSGQRFKWIKGKLVQYLYPIATRIIAVSRGTREDLIKHYKIPPGKCIVIYNPFDVGDIRKKYAEPISHSWYQEDVPIIAACGRLNAQKNYPLLFRALKAVLNEVNVKLLVIGEGEDRASLESLSNSLGIAQNVIFLGFQQNPYKYIAKADVFVLSSWFEGFGNVIVEAMACGIAVIATRCPSGPDEIITDGVNGFLVPVGDVQILAESILILLNNKELRKKLAAAGLKRAEDFRAEKVVAEYEKIFMDVI